MLTPKQTRFVEEYLVDLNGKQAGIRAGYAPASAEVQPSRLLRNAKVQKALEAAMQARSKRTEVTADFSVTEFAKVAFANVWDFLPKKGETIDLSRVDQDRTAAVEEITVVEAVDTAVGAALPNSSCMTSRRRWRALHGILGCFSTSPRGASSKGS